MGAQKRVRELDDLIKNLYESNATGRIPDKHFERLFAEYDSEQNRLEKQILELQTCLEEYTKSKVGTDKFIEIIRKYQGCEKVTTPMLNEFIEKIVVHEADTSGGRTKAMTVMLWLFAIIIVLLEYDGGIIGLNQKKPINQRFALV